MGQARQRGTLEQRQAEGIAKRQAKEQAREQAREQAKEQVKEQARGRLTQHRGKASPYLAAMLALGVGLL